MKFLSKLNTFYKISLAVFMLLWAIRLLFPSVLNHREPEPEDAPLPPVVNIPEDEQEAMRPSQEELRRVFGTSTSDDAVSEFLIFIISLYITFVFFLLNNFFRT